jgi:hypothetical protein
MAEFYFFKEGFHKGVKRVKLITKEIEGLFKKLGRQGNVDDPIVVAKFFNPTGAGTWYATELIYVISSRGESNEPETLEVEASKIDQFKDYEVIDKLFFGYVSIFGDHCDEWGYFRLSELESVKCPPFGLGIERDLYFDPKPISKVCPKAVIAIS